jgi:hypothetical protein
MSAPETERARLLRKADPSRLCDWTHTNRFHRFIPGAADEPADLMVPAYWLPLVSRFVQNDIVYAIPADSSWIAELMVREVGPEGVFMVAMRQGAFEDRVQAPGATRRAEHTDGDVRFVFDGPLTKWQVWEGDRKHKEGLETEDQARAWYAQHLRMRKRAGK